MTTATACVFGFKGTAYWSRPGYDFRPDKVREDFGAWRPAQSQDGRRIASWLVRNGYRVAWRKIGRGADAVAYEEYWVRMDVLGGPEVKYIEPRDIRAALEALQEAAHA